MLFEDQVVVVTGSTMGIGRAVAERCATEGAKVLVHGLEEDLGKQIVDHIGSDRAVYCPADLSEPQAPEQVVAAAVSAFGKIDGLVNNAAIVPRSTIETTSAEFFDRVMAINVRAPMLMIQAALPELKKTKGRVVNIGSINAHCGEGTLLDYSIAKGALLTLSRNLGDALHCEGVRVNQINPGWVLSEGEHRRQVEENNMPQDWFERLDATAVPAGRITRPDEVAGIVAFWLSEQSFPASGSVIDIEQFPVIGRNPVKEM